MIYFKKCGEILIYTLVKINSDGYSNDHKVHSDLFPIFKPPSLHFFPGVIRVKPIFWCTGKPFLVWNSHVTGRVLNCKLWVSISSFHPSIGVHVDNCITSNYLQCFRHKRFSYNCVLVIAYKVLYDQYVYGNTSM